MLKKPSLSIYVNLQQPPKGTCVILKIWIVEVWQIGHAWDDKHVIQIKIRYSTYVLSIWRIKEQQSEKNKYMAYAKLCNANLKTSCWIKKLVPIGFRTNVWI